MKYEKIAKIAERMAEEYHHLKVNYKHQLFEDFNIDSGIDYARYLLDDLLWNTKKKEYIW